LEKTLEEVLTETRINRSTFQKYKTLGLLPRPTRMEMLRGRGSVAYYPDNIIRLIEWIREWQAEGETLKQAN
jgi:DNA-binding transcriptional MerR regulator